MIVLQHVSYRHPDKVLLFEDLNLAIGRYDKISITGNNGVGKSTLLRLLAGELPLSGGKLQTNTTPFYLPQNAGQLSDCTVAEALHAAEKLQALEEILAGKVSDANLAILNDDWTIDARCKEALAYWGLQHLHYHQKLATLSGGQKTKVLLAGIHVANPGIILLDEPGNHLDVAGRLLLCKFITDTKAAIVIVSHDRSLLNLLDTVWELTPKGINVFGGNYDFYLQQKAIAREALHVDVSNAEKALRKARATEREAIERKQKQDARGKKKQQKAGLPTIAMNTLRNNAQRSAAKIKEVHAGKANGLLAELADLRKDLPATDTIKMDFEDSALHRGKVLIDANGINVNYDAGMIWQNPVDICILSGERVALSGNNGSGKTTLLKVLLGLMQPSAGTIYRSAAATVYVDQEYSLLNPVISELETAQHYNTGSLQDHEIKIRLSRFLFLKDDWDKRCEDLSGGEKMRLILCCLTIRKTAPDLIVLDEPTNNLDIQNIEILANAIVEYNGTLLVVSHDTCFLNQICIDRTFALP